MRYIHQLEHKKSSWIFLMWEFSSTTRYWHMIEGMCKDYHKVSYRKHKANFLDIVKREWAQRVIKNTLNLNLSHDEKSEKTFFITWRNSRGERITAERDNIECHCTIRWYFMLKWLMFLCMQIYSWIRLLLLSSLNARVHRVNHKWNFYKFII